MNERLTPEKTSFCVANFRSSTLLRAIRRLESDFYRRNLFRPELIRGSLIELRIIRRAILKSMDHDMKKLKLLAPDSDDAVEISNDLMHCKNITDKIKNTYYGQ